MVSTENLPSSERNRRFAKLSQIAEYFFHFPFLLDLCESGRIASLWQRRYSFELILALSNSTRGNFAFENLIPSVIAFQISIQSFQLSSWPSCAYRVTYCFQKLPSFVHCSAQNEVTQSIWNGRWTSKMEGIFYFACGTLTPGYPVHTPRFEWK